MNHSVDKPRTLYHNYTDYINGSYKMILLRNVHKDIPNKSRKFGIIIFVGSHVISKWVFVPGLPYFKQRLKSKGISLLMFKNTLKTCKTHSFVFQ